MFFNKTVKDVRSAYFSNLINTNSHNSRFLFNIINDLTNPWPSIVSSSIDCRSFLSFFCGQGL